jgi:hypothetical protein
LGLNVGCRDGPAFRVTPVGVIGVMPVSSRTRPDADSFAAANHNYRCTVSDVPIWTTFNTRQRGVDLQGPNSEVGIAPAIAA